MVLIEILKGLIQRLLYVNLILIVHRNNKLIEVYLTRIILIHRRNQLVQLRLRQMLELVHVGSQSSHQLSLINQTIPIAIDTRENLS